METLLRQLSKWCTICCAVLFIISFEGALPVLAESSFTGSRINAVVPVYDTLSEQDRIVYEILKNGITDIAKGNREETVITVSAEELGLPVSYTDDDLGIQIYNPKTGEWNTERASEIIYSGFSFDFGRVMRALDADLPFETFWNYAAAGEQNSMSYPGISYSYDGYSGTAQLNGDIVFYLAVETKYRDGGVYSANAEQLRGIYNTVLSQAQGVVGEAVGLSDYEKLVYYKDWICQQVTYDYDSADAIDTISDRGAWNLVNVFDMDSSTNVVCEGYAEAFQFLCDLTNFSNPAVKAYCVTGNMTGGTGAGPHKWTLVTMPDDRNYVTDITVTDSFENDKLFLAGAEGDSSSYTVSWPEESFPVDGGIITYPAGSVHYSYDEESLNLYSDMLRTVSSEAYDHSVIHPESVVLDTYELELAENQTVVLNATVTPEGADQTITWTSSDESVATVDETGTVTGIRFGSAVITATAMPGVSASVSVTVTHVHEYDTFVWESDESSHWHPCLTCDEGRGSEEEHDFNLVVDKAPTCTEAGLGHEECNVCGYTKEAVQIPATGHNWSEWTAVTEPTCTEPGEETRTCANDPSHTETRTTEALGHDLRHVEEIPATCQEEGTREYWECEVCGKKYEDAEGTTEITDIVIPKTEHSYEWMTDQAATCTEAGSRHEECSMCGKRGEDEVIPALGHDWGEWTVTSEATCTEAGEETRTCANDPSHTETRTTEALGHDLKHVAEVPATCQEEGTREYWECEVCGKKYEDAEGTTEITDIVVPKVDHNYEWKTDKEAACTEAGSRHEECSVCHDRKEAVEIPALGHDLTHKEATSATCEEAGNSEYWTCSRCEKYFSDEEGTTEFEKDSWVIPATGHDWGEWIKDYETKTMTMECRICGQIEEGSGAWKENSKGWWFEWDDGTYPNNEFEKITGQTYYFDNSGYIVTGWKEIDGDYYFFQSSGAMKKNAWEGNYYLLEDGKMAKDQWVDGGKYYVDKTGKWHKAHWESNSKGWWYVNEDTTYPVDEFKAISGTTYYFKPDGYMATGWQKIGDDWYYFASSGAMRTGWQKISNIWYYFKSNGTMATGQQSIGSSVYYFATSGAMATGWKLIDGKYYFFQSSGAMKKNAWEGNYYLKADGSMAVSDWVDNNRYYVDENGKWVPGKTR